MRGLALATPVGAPSMKTRRRSAEPSSPRARPSIRSPVPSRSSTTADHKVRRSAASVGGLKSMGGVPDGCCAAEGATGDSPYDWWRHRRRDRRPSSPRSVIRHSRLGRTGSSSAVWIPRPKRYGPEVELDLPRSAVGINEYIYALSLRHPEAVRYASVRPAQRPRWRGMRREAPAAA